jgi:pimeloyl-ACP methyl ester carboxylesterase
LVPLQDAAVTGVPATSGSVAAHPELGGYLEVRPRQGPVDTLLLLYPGGLVRPQAYAWLGVALAPYGVRTVIPVMPLDLAVLAPDRVDRLLAGLTSVPERVVLAGHSLGGAMAARYALRNPGKIDALVLLGAYSARGDDLSGLDLPVLDVAAEHDGLATVDKVRAGLQRLPPDTRLVVVPGAVHAFFGRYGPQRGDGSPAVPRARAEAEVVAALRALLTRLGAGE